MDGVLIAEGGRKLRVSAHDVSTGATLRTYAHDSEGGASSICLLKEYVLCALRSQPFIFVWHLRKPEQVHLKIACVGLVSALACSPDGVFCAAAIGEKIRVWEVCSGNLLAVVSQHYQPVTVLRFTDDGVHLLSGGADARVVVWRFSSVLSEAYISSGHSIPHAPRLQMTTPTGSSTPVTRHVWSDHSLPVTDIYCGTGGPRARVATASLDQTCKLYELVSGRLLCSFLFDFGLTAVTMDLAEHRLFVGGSNGKIAQVNLFLQHSNRAQKLTNGEEADQYSRFTGHTKAIRGLAVSTLGHLLVSGSEDKTAIVWDIASHQVLRTINMKGPVNSLLLSCLALLNPKQGSGSLPSLQPFQKRLHYSSTPGSQEEGRGEGAQKGIPILIQGVDPSLSPKDIAGSDIKKHMTSLAVKKLNVYKLCDLASLKECECGYFIPSVQSTSVTAEQMKIHKAQEEVSEMKDVHRRLYTFVTNELLETS